MEVRIHDFSCQWFSESTTNIIHCFIQLEDDWTSIGATSFYFQLLVTVVLVHNFPATRLSSSHNMYLPWYESDGLHRSNLNHWLGELESERVCGANSDSVQRTGVSSFHWTSHCQAFPSASITFLHQIYRLHLSDLFCVLHYLTGTLI